MARVVSALFGNGSKGKVGNTVFRNTKGVTGERQVIATEYQPNVANPQSAGQMYRRVLLGTATRLCSALNQSAPIKQLYTRRVGNKSYFNWQVQNLLRATGIPTVKAVPEESGIAGTGEVASAADIATAEVRWTQGDLSFVQVAADGIAYNGVTGELSGNLTWDASIGVFDLPTDQVAIWIIDLANGATYTEISGAVRVNATGSFDIASPILLQSANVKIVGFSFFRMDVNGLAWSQVSYPRLSIDGSGAFGFRILPDVLLNAYKTGIANVTPTPQQGGSGIPM